MCTSKLISFAYKGTTEDTCSLWNLHGLSDFVISMQYSGHGDVTTVFKVPNEKVPAVWRKLGRDPLTCPVRVKD